MNGEEYIERLRRELDRYLDPIVWQQICQQIERILADYESSPLGPVSCDPIYLTGTAHVARGLTVPCPVCREQPGHACGTEGSKPAVHDARESLAYWGKKIWT